MYELIVLVIAVIGWISKAVRDAAKTQVPPTLPQQYVPPATFGAPPPGAPYSAPQPGWAPVVQQTPPRPTPGGPSWANGAPLPQEPYGGSQQLPQRPYGASQPPPQYQYGAQQMPPPAQAPYGVFPPQQQNSYGTPGPPQGTGYAQQPNWIPIASVVETPPRQAVPPAPQPYQFQVGSSMGDAELGQFDNDAALRLDARQMKAREPGAAKTAEESSRVSPVRKLTNVLAEKDPLIAAFIMHEVLAPPRSRAKPH